jgi:Uma2 family endonuclease
MNKLTRHKSLRMATNFAQLESQVLDMPDLPLFIEKLQMKLHDEKKDREEFYKWITEDHKAEFINGRIVMHSPASNRHNKSVKNLLTVTNTYATINDLGEVLVEKALIALTRNDYEPDLAFWKKEKANTFTDDLNIYPPPDFVVEVLSKDSIKRDKKTKFDDYAAHGITEYWIIDPKKLIVEQYILPDEESNVYALLKKATLDDDIESYVIEGFKIPVKAIFDAKVNLDTLKILLSK